VIGVGEAVRTGPSRGDDRLLAEAQRRLLGAEEREQIGDRLAPLRVGERVPVPLVYGEPEAIGSRQLRKERRRLDVGRPQLEVRAAGPAGRARGQERASEIRSSAAGPGDDAARRPFEREEVGVEDSRLVEGLEGTGVVSKVELVARPPLESPLLVRADLAGDAVRAQERETAPRDGAARELEVERDAPAPAQVDAAGAADEGRQLGQPAAGLPRLDGRELLPDVLGEGQSSTPSSASRRRLYSAPSEP
jgi:hypothetical protein